MTISPELAAIRAGTYPEMATSAELLYARLRWQQAQASEVVDFAAAGEVGLDVGSYDGAYRSVIGGLGLKRVISIEPQPEPLERGIAAGIIPSEDAFLGTLQKWTDGNPPAAAVFVFNMMQVLPNDPTFIEALATATAAGGILAVSFREAATNMQFTWAMAHSQSPPFRRLDPTSPLSTAPRSEWIRNKFLHLYRRTG